MRAVLCWVQFHLIPYKHSESRILLLMLLLLSHGILQRHRHLFPRQFSPLAIKRENDPQCTHSFTENPTQTPHFSRPAKTTTSDTLRIFSNRAHRKHGASELTPKPKTQHRFLLQERCCSSNNNNNDIVKLTVIPHSIIIHQKRLEFLAHQKSGVPTLVDTRPDAFLHQSSNFENFLGLTCISSPHRPKPTYEPSLFVLPANAGR